MDINALLQGLLPDQLYALIGSILLFVCGLTALICTVLPAPKEDASAVYKALYKVLNLLGANAGKAANADDVARRQGKQ